MNLRVSENVIICYCYYFYYYCHFVINIFISSSSLPSLPLMLYCNGFYGRIRDVSSAAQRPVYRMKELYMKCTECVFCKTLYLYCNGVS
jgi:hypothetical protein